MEYLDASAIVRCSLLDGSIFIPADADTDRESRRLASREARGDCMGAIVVEPHAIGQPRILRQSEHPRTRISRLGTQRDRADFGKAESERLESFGDGCVLVKARRDTDGIREYDAAYRSLDSPYSSESTDEIT